MTIFSVRQTDCSPVHVSYGCRGLLCADVHCTTPATDIDIRVDDWNSAGDEVRVAVGQENVAVVYSDGFNNGAGVVLATVPIDRLGLESFVAQSIYGTVVVQALACNASQHCSFHGVGSRSRSTDRCCSLLL